MAWVSFVGRYLCDDAQRVLKREGKREKSRWLGRGGGRYMLLLGNDKAQGGSTLLRGTRARREAPEVSRLTDKSTDQMMGLIEEALVVFVSPPSTRLDRGAAFD
jgi:hypothetical protein